MLTICFTTMGNGYHFDPLGGIINQVKNSGISNTNPVNFLPLKFLNARGSWRLLKGEEFTFDPMKQ